MIIALGVLGFGFFTALYFFVQRNAVLPDPEGARVVASARHWRERYLLPTRCAMSLARGAKVLNHSYLFLALASIFGAVGAENPRNDMAFGVFVVAATCAMVAVPLIATAVGYTGWPRGWLMSGSDKLSLDDLEPQ